MMANFHKLLLVGTVIFCVSLLAMSAKAQQMRFQIWSDFNARIELKNRFQVNVEPGYRIDPEFGIQTVYLRPTLRYAPNRILAFDAGVANFNVWGADAFNSIEFRTFQFAFLNWPEIWEFNFKFRAGLEQRWFRFPELDTDEFVIRARFRIRMTSPYFQFWQGESRLFITTNYELLRDVKEEDIDVYFSCFTLEKTLFHLLHLTKRYHLILAPKKSNMGRQ